MIIRYTEHELINFETDIANSFNSKRIKAPIHLYDGNESQMINVFKNINENDWVFCTWRSHYQCLLKGVPKEILKRDIESGKSMGLCYPNYNIYSSAIVTGCIPIALGVAFDLKRKGSTEKVWCWVGDMTSETGCFHENYKYSIKHDLPITWVIEDNGKSVCSDTYKVWNITELTYHNGDKVVYYKYQSKYPHAGSGTRIQF